MQDQSMPPIFLFQMGKVGSSSLKSTLSAKYKGSLVHAHTFGDMSPEDQELLSERIRLNLPVNVICPIRDPLSRNVSAFFQNFKRYTGFNFGERSWSLKELRSLFLRHSRHNESLEWFDRHLRTTFGIDVFAEPFPIRKKWNVYTKGSVRILVYRSDIDHSEQLSVISQFLGFEIKEWAYDNKSENKVYGEKYKEFCSLVTLPDIYITIMCDSRLCRQFWSKEEIEVFSRKWKE